MGGLLLGLKLGLARRAAAGPAGFLMLAGSGGASLSGYVQGQYRSITGQPWPGANLHRLIHWDGGVGAVDFDGDRVAALQPYNGLLINGVRSALPGAWRFDGTRTVRGLNQNVGGLEDFVPGQSYNLQLVG